MNRLYYGDNLYYLRELDTASVDLIYLDPPFNSKAAYNLFFRSPGGDTVQAQTTAFRDTWRWDAPAEEAFDDVLASGSLVAPILRSLRGSLGQSDMMAYLAMMTVRLVEMRRLLRPEGSLYLHCDPTASHYLKVILDGIFGGNFRNEIVWKRTTTHSDSKTWSRVSDSILFYTVGKAFTWNTPREPLSAGYIADKYSHDDGDGRRYQLDNMTSPNPRPNMMYEWKGFPHPAKGWRYSRETMARLDSEGLIWYPTNADGSPDPTRRLRFKRYLETSEGGVMGNIWTDIHPVNSQAKERIGYPTQKPVALLERILSASSNPGQVVLDPFCGCGTTVEAAQRLARQWIGIDITHHAIDVIEGRLNDRCPSANYKVQGRPEDLDAARDLAKRDKYEFQWWANWLIGAQNYRERKKGADGGIDGVIYFRNGPFGVGNVVISVKGGDNIGVQMVRDLRGTIEREGAEMGILITLARPTAPMIAEAAAAGFVRESAHGRLPRLQISTVEDLLNGRRPIHPPPIETEAFRQKLRPVRPVRQAAPNTQLSLPLTFTGGKRKGDDFEEHLSGAVLARLSNG